LKIIRLNTLMLNVSLIVYTHNFKRFGTAKQLASYAGEPLFPTFQEVA